MLALAAVAISTAAIIYAMNKKKTPYEIAQGEIGQHEISGPQSNLRILEYLRTSINSSLAQYDETHWCAAFVNFCLMVSGLPQTGTAWARDFLKYGTPVTKDNARVGDIVVFSRGTGGHVGFFAGWANSSKTLINVLGGNQSDSVKYSNYSTTNLLGIRRHA